MKITELIHELEGTNPETAEKLKAATNELLEKLYAKANLAYLKTLKEPWNKGYMTGRQFAFLEAAREI